MPMRSYLTIRNVPETLRRALAREAKQRGMSLNRTVLALLASALGQDPAGAFDNGLGELAGGWSESDLEDFHRAVAPFDQVDPELWS